MFEITAMQCCGIPLDTDFGLFTPEFNHRWVEGDWKSGKHVQVGARKNGGAIPDLYSHPYRCGVTGRLKIMSCKHIIEGDRDSWQGEWYSDTARPWVAYIGHED